MKNVKLLMPVLAFAVSCFLRQLKQNCARAGRATGDTSMMSRSPFSQRYKKEAKIKIIVFFWEALLKYRNERS